MNDCAGGLISPSSHCCFWWQHNWCYTTAIPGQKETRPEVLSDQWAGILQKHQHSLNQVAAVLPPQAVMGVHNA